jgi:hypothetical protein
MTTDNFFNSQNRLIHTGQTGGQLYSDTSPFSVPWCYTLASSGLTRKNKICRVSNTPAYFGPPSVTKKERFMTLRPKVSLAVADVIKFFTAVSYDFL